MKKIQFYIKRRGELLDTLQRLVVYCHHNAAWQDDHPEVLRNAELALKEAGIVWQEDPK